MTASPLSPIPIYYFIIYPAAYFDDVTSMYGSLRECTILSQIDRKKLQRAIIDFRKKVKILVFGLFSSLTPVK